MLNNLISTELRDLRLKSFRVSKVRREKKCGALSRFDVTFDFHLLQGTFTTPFTPFWKQLKPQFLLLSFSLSHSLTHSLTLSLTGSLSLSLLFAVKRIISTHQIIVLILTKPIYLFSLCRWSVAVSEKERERDGEWEKEKDGTDRKK